MFMEHEIVDVQSWITYLTSQMEKSEVLLHYFATEVHTCLPPMCCAFDLHPYTFRDLCYVTLFFTSFLVYSQLSVAASNLFFIA